MKKRDIYFFIGTTAELIKLAPVINQLKKRRVGFKIITSGQNYVGFEEMEPLIGKQKAYYSFGHKIKSIPGAVYLNFVMWVLFSMFIYIPYFRKEFKGLNKESIYFIVHGDTVTSLLGAIVARIFGVKVVHIESGYKSVSLMEPFPEELSRRGVSLLTDIHFCPNLWCMNNLKHNKGVKVNTYLNTAYEICMKALKLKAKSFKLPREKFFILILHRQEHMLFQKDLTKQYIKTITSLTKSNLKCYFILHHVTENFLKSEGLLEGLKKNPNVKLQGRIPYIDFQKLLFKSEFIATDGGGNQQEAYFLGKPCLLLRKYVEGIEGMESNAVLAKDDMGIVKDFLKNYKSKAGKKIAAKKLPSKIIVDTLLES